MDADAIEIRLPTRVELRTWLRGVLGIRSDVADDGEAVRHAMERRYDEVSRCC